MPLMGGDWRCSACFGAASLGRGGGCTFKAACWAVKLLVVTVRGSGSGVAAAREHSRMHTLVPPSATPSRRKRICSAMMQEEAAAASKQACNTFGRLLQSAARCTSGCSVHTVPHHTKNNKKM